MSEIRVLDVGCGDGLYVEAMRAKGINAVGIDVDPMLKELEYLHRIDVLSPAFDQFLLERGVFDLTICLEVAEHIPESKSFDLVQRLCKTAPRILFSAASHGQGGLGHINCQVKPFWLSLFEKHGFFYDTVSTAKFMEYLSKGYHMGWLMNNAMFFKSYGAVSFKTIRDEESPQAERIADFIPTFLNL